MTNIYEALYAVKQVLDIDIFPLMDTLETTDPVLSGKLSVIMQKCTEVQTQLTDIEAMALSLSAPYGRFSVSTLTIPADTVAFAFSPASAGNLSVSASGNVILKAGYSYDIEMNIRVAFILSGYLLYSVPSLSTTQFVEIAVTLNNPTYYDPISLRVSTGKILVDTEIPIIAGLRASCTNLTVGELFVRGHYVG